MKQQAPLEAIAWYAWEADEAESNWLLTYVDMLSVILAMLVVLLGHMAANHMRSPAPAVEKRPAIEQVLPLKQKEEKKPEVPAKPIEPAPVKTPVVEVDPASRLVKAIETQFQGEIKVVRQEQGISLEIAEVILFESGKADLLPEAAPVLTRLANTLQAIGDVEIAVEGHTDNRPILGGRFDSNWALAAARANAVTRFLIGRGLAPKRLRSVSYADTRPVADNDTEQGRAENRRVNLKVKFL